MLRPAWLWLLAAPLALLGTFQAIRDEFLSEPLQRRYQLRQYLEYAPDWPLSWWIIIALVLLLVFTLEGGYREIERLRARARLGRRRISVSRTEQTATTSNKPVHLLHLDMQPSTRDAMLRLTAYIEVVTSRAGYPERVLFTIFREDNNLAGKKRFLFEWYPTAYRPAKLNMF
jgi:hypothetical protein